MITPCWKILGKRKGRCVTAGSTDNTQDSPKPYCSRDPKYKKSADLHVFVLSVVGLRIVGLSEAVWEWRGWGVIASNSPHVTRTHHSTTLTQDAAPRYRKPNWPRNISWFTNQNNEPISRILFPLNKIVWLSVRTRRVYSQHDAEAIHGNCFIAGSRHSAQPQSKQYTLDLAKPLRRRQCCYIFSRMCFTSHKCKSQHICTVRCSIRAFFWHFEGKEVRHGWKRKKG